MQERQHTSFRTRLDEVADKKLKGHSESMAWRSSQALDRAKGLPKFWSMTNQALIDPSSSSNASETTVFVVQLDSDHLVNKLSSSRLVSWRLSGLLYTRNRSLRTEASRSGSSIRKKSDICNTAPRHLVNFFSSETTILTTSVKQPLSAYGKVSSKVFTAARKVDSVAVALAIIRSIRRARRNRISRHGQNVSRNSIMAQ